MNKKQSHELLPLVNRFSSQCFKTIFNPSFKCESKQPAYFIFIANLIEIAFMNKTTKMIESIFSPLNIKF